MKILVNHVGFSGEARAVLQGSADENFPRRTALVDDEGNLIAEYETGEAIEVAGWTNRRFSVVEFRPPPGGPYRLACGEGTVSAEFHAGPDLVAKRIISDLLFGFRTVRSAGACDEADQSVPFHGGRSGTVDVRGGWYDASGDTSKYLSHLNYANFMNPQQIPLVCWVLLDSLGRLSMNRFPMEGRLELRFREEAAWGIDFLVRMQDPRGYFYTTVFDQWTKDLDNRRIASFRTQEGVLGDDYEAGYRQGGGIAIAALARAFALLTGNPKRSEYRDAALRGWRHLERYNVEYLDNGEENIIDDACALMAAAELWDAEIADSAGAIRRRCGNLIDRWDAESGCFAADRRGEWSWFHASDEALPLVALMRVLEVREVPFLAANKIVQIIQDALAAELHRAEKVVNPFLHPRRVVRMPGRKEREQFFYPHENPSDYWWQGENARLASWAAACRRWGLKNSPQGGNRGFLKALLRFADAQESWILGLNPFDVCMLQGQGRNNPAYDWDHFNVPGGVANGITSGFRDEDDIAFQPPEAANDRMHSWRWGEQWIPHAAWLLLASAWSVPVQH